MATITYRDAVAIVELLFYSPALVIAVFLAIRHGFERSAGWLFLVLFTLARVLAAAFHLAIINAPPSSLISLYVGESILLGIGPSQLELIFLGLLSRVLISINRSKTTLITQGHMRILQLLTVVGLILGIVGGVNASNQLAKTGVYTVQPLSKASVAIFIVMFVLLAVGTVITSFYISHAAPGEKRVLLAVALALPFTMVRLIFSAISAFAYSPDFNVLIGNPTIYLCMSFLMEVIVVLIVEAVGVTLNKVRPIPLAADAPPEFAMDRLKQPSARSGGVLSTLGRRTLIGRLVTSRASNNEEVNTEHSGHGRHARRHRNEGY